MYGLLVRLMVATAVAQLGLSWSELADCRGRGCVLRLQRAMLEVARIEWRPISVSPRDTKVSPR